MIKTPYVSLKSKKSLIGIFLLFITVASLFTAYIATNKDQLLFASEESKTDTNADVYNAIKWFDFKNQDVWMMKQSHHGLNHPMKHWDRLAIVIDKTQNPKKAHFYQLPKGELTWNESWGTQPPKSLPYKVSCYLCHANGLRALRPQKSSSSFFETLKVTYWNLKIKSYGRVLPDNSHFQKQAKTTPFAYTNDFSLETLKVKACIYCHKEKGFLARGTLKRQHRLTIKHMVEKGHMPPFGIKLSQKDKQDINNFINGF